MLDGPDSIRGYRGIWQLLQLKDITFSFGELSGVEEGDLGGQL